MGTNEVAETSFRQTLRRERGSRGWSQAHLAELMCGKGLRTYATTVAKIESGERAVRVDELVAVADLFGVSTDVLLGHQAGRAGDKDFLIFALADVGMRSLWQLGSTDAALRRAIVELAGFKLRGAEQKLVTGCQQAADHMADAIAAIRRTESAMATIEQRGLRHLMGEE